MHTRNILRRLLPAPALVRVSDDRSRMSCEKSGGRRGRPAARVEGVTGRVSLCVTVPRLLSSEALVARHHGCRRRRFTDQSHDR